MGKYDPLGRDLRRQRSAGIELRFAEIERILHATPPNHASPPKWWGIEGAAQIRQVQQAAWRGVG
jgi:hypothetical protein